MEVGSEGGGGKLSGDSAISTKGPPFWAGSTFPPKTQGEETRTPFSPAHRQRIGNTGSKKTNAMSAWARACILY